MSKLKRADGHNGMEQIKALHLKVGERFVKNGWEYEITNRSYIKPTRTIPDPRICFVCNREPDSVAGRCGLMVSYHPDDTAYATKLGIINAFRVVMGKAL